MDEASEGPARYLQPVPSLYEQLLENPQAASGVNIAKVSTDHSEVGIRGIKRDNAPGFVATRRTGASNCAV